MHYYIRLFALKDLDRTSVAGKRSAQVPPSTDAIRNYSLEIHLNLGSSGWRSGGRDKTSDPIT